MNDERRVDFLRGYLKEFNQAVETGVDLRGYFCWTLMDNFEWALKLTLKSKADGLCKFRRLGRFRFACGFFESGVLRADLRIDRP